MKDHNKIIEEYIKNGGVGDLDLSKSNIKRLPGGLNVGGDLNLGCCYKLTSIGDNLKVNGDLHLYGCLSLSYLPDNLELNGELNLSGCGNLTSLPDNLIVNGDFYLGSTKIKTLPPTLEVKGDIYVDEDFNLEAYVRQTFIKIMEGEPVPIIEGEIIKLF